jgi:hypothetical protein
MTRAEYSVTGVVGTLPYGSNTLLEGIRARLLGEREAGDGDFCSSLRLSCCMEGLVSTTWLDSCLLGGAVGVRQRTKRNYLWGASRSLALQQSKGVEDERATANCLLVRHSAVLCFSSSLRLSRRVCVCNNKLNKNRIVPLVLAFLLLQR